MSTGDTNVPVQLPGKTVNNSPRDSGLADLTQLARQAFEERRRKQSVVLADAILQIDPDNKEALVIRAWVQQDLKKQLRNAKAQIAEARRENVLGLWDRAERLVREVLSIDPDDEEAKALLAEVIPAQQALVEKLEFDNEPAHEDFPNEPERVAVGVGRVNRSTAVGIILAILVVLGILFVALRNPAATNEEVADAIAASEISEPTSPAPVSESCLQLQAPQALERLKSRIEPQIPQAERPQSPVSGLVKITINEKGEVKVGDMHAPIAMIGPLKEAVEQWRFTPANEDGKLRCVETELQISLNP